MEECGGSASGSVFPRHSESAEAAPSDGLQQQEISSGLSRCSGPPVRRGDRCSCLVLCQFHEIMEVFS